METYVTKGSGLEIETVKEAQKTIKTRERRKEYLAYG